MLSNILFNIFLLIVVTYSSDFPPLWFSGHWQGDVIYSPVGATTNYSIVFRTYNANMGPNGTLLFETTMVPDSIQKSYQQWWIVGNDISYCGLLTFNNGEEYGITYPRFRYYSQMSNSKKVVFCGEPTSGGCDSFMWVWTYIDSNTFNFWNTVGGYPHENTTFHLISRSVDNIPVDTSMRANCAYLLGAQMPFNYAWLPFNLTIHRKILPLSHLRRGSNHEYKRPLFHSHQMFQQEEVPL